MNSLRSARNLALVLWSGRIGGAETFNVALAERLRALGAHVTVVFIEDAWPLADRLAGAGIPYRALGFGRGRAILRHPRRYAALVATEGPDGALVLECGYIGAALRAGGYSGPIMGVEHGSALLPPRVLTKPRRLLRWVNRATGAWADDVEVAVSEFMLEQARRNPHARRLQCIYNGVDPELYGGGIETAGEAGRALVIGFAGRLIVGKGANHLIEAVANARDKFPARLLIAGDGPERPGLERAAETLGIAQNVEFVGLVHDMPAFWRECHVAAVPSEYTESFAMAALEAMASGKPVVATHVGAIPELVVDGVTGSIVPPRDPEALGRALVTYATQPEVRAAHGSAARARATERFDIGDCAHAYLELFDELKAGRRGRR